MYYNNNPIEIIQPNISESPSKEIRNLILGLPIHAIDIKDESTIHADRPHMNYNTDCRLLTDGVYSPDRDWHNEQWFHSHSGGGRAITFKLPCLCSVCGFSMSTNREDAVGIRSPRYIKIRVSYDGSDFTTVWEQDTRSPRDMRTVLYKGEFEPVMATYVQFVYDTVHHVYIDELELYGCTDTTGALMPINDGKPMFNEFESATEINEYPDENILGSSNIALSYNYRPIADDKGLQTESDYLPLVAYLSEKGELLDTFMDGFLYLPDVSFDFSPRGQHVEGWQEYVESVFVPDKNLSALDKTVGRVKQAVGLADYKVGVYFTILYTFTGHDDFGYLNGEHLVFDNVESRKKAIKWLIDTMISRYNECNYENTALLGFYWFEEALNPTDKYEEELIKFTCDYVHKKGYKCFWIPYFRALGYEHWQKYGFDTACMQPNYMFDLDIQKSRLYDTASEAKRMGMCVELEVWKIQEDVHGNIDNPEHIKRFMEYLTVGAETGYMNTAKIYYHGSAIGGVITKGWRSKNPLYREMYDMTYKFAKRKL
ncbi:MAG: DUF4855 domain-containing protein [Clostridia bacterium]|nr:DUF4855 domain-containing protein [Clostridia bacterium]